jgi:hypothetical protein
VPGKNIRLYSDNMQVYSSTYFFLIPIITVVSSLYKGIVSRDLSICSWYQWTDLKFLHIQRVLICFYNFVFVSNFSIFVSRRSEFTL